MKLQSVQFSEAAQIEFQHNYASFLCTSQGYDVRRKDEMTTILIPAYCNLGNSNVFTFIEMLLTKIFSEPVGYGLDLREGFRKRTVGGYFLTNPFQVNSALKLDNGWFKYEMQNKTDIKVVPF